jgi:hypothetical protein
MMGASDAELEEAARFASDTAKYCACLHSQSVDLEEFKKTAEEIGEYVGKTAQEAKRVAA